MEIKKTSLNKLHQVNQAKFVEFAGYEMPIQYSSGIIEEHKFTRSNSGIFDVSHMGQLFIYGDDNLTEDLEKIFPLDLKNLKLNSSKYSFLMNDKVFTGDTLLINGTGRTDFQNGNALDQYESIFKKLLKLPEKTLVYPAHDYNGKRCSTIRDEKNNNPRLQVTSAEEYTEIMNKLILKDPEMMDIAVPANVKGFTLEQVS